MLQICLDCICLTLSTCDLWAFPNRLKHDIPSFTLNKKQRRRSFFSLSVWNPPFFFFNHYLASEMFPHRQWHHPESSFLSCRQRYSFSSWDGFLSSDDVSVSDNRLPLLFLSRPPMFIRGETQPRGFLDEISPEICSVFGWRRWQLTKAPGGSV